MTLEMNSMKRRISFSLKPTAKRLQARIKINEDFVEKIGSEKIYISEFSDQQTKSKIPEKKHNPVILPLKEHQQDASDEGIDYVRMPIKNFCTEYLRPMGWEQSKETGRKNMSKEEKCNPVIPPLKDHLQDAPDEGIDYVRMPIKDFGAAYLRAVGWEQSVGIGRTNVQCTEPIELINRPARLGLGADSRQRRSKDFSNGGK